MFLIDGYNLLHAAFGGSSGGDLRRLVDLLVDFCRKGGYRVRLVLDATGDMPRRRRLGDVEIRNVPRGRSADEEIVETLSASGDRAAHTLVTDDRSLAREARQLGVKVVPCMVFFRLLQERRGPLEDRKPAAPLSPLEVDYWMDEFGLNC